MYMSILLVYFWRQRNFQVVTIEAATFLGSCVLLFLQLKMANLDDLVGFALTVANTL